MLTFDLYLHLNTEIINPQMALQCLLEPARLLYPEFSGSVSVCSGWVSGCVGWALPWVHGQASLCSCFPLWAVCLGDPSNRTNKWNPILEFRPWAAHWTLLLGLGGLCKENGCGHMPSEVSVLPPVHYMPVVPLILLSKGRFLPAQIWGSPKLTYPAFNHPVGAN